MIFKHSKKLFKTALVLAIPLLLVFTNSCRKDQFGSGAISFSNDTLTFDTVFTTLGSTTQYFKVYNRGSKGVKIDNVQLMHLTGTQFRINVDGTNGDHFTGVEIPAKDSMYVFVEVTVNPNDQTQPFVIIDDVNFTIGSSTQTVHLQAFGQNAHFHYGQEITTSTTWTNDLPHVILSHDTNPGVVVDCGATLTIMPGTKVFFAGNSGLFVEGNLVAEAHDWADSIIFRGARLEQYYDDKPGQWFGIVFLRNDNCNPSGSFDHCVVNESSYGIYAGAGLSQDITSYQGATKPIVTIKNTIVKNTQNNAIYGFNAQITAENSLFYAAGDNLVKLGLGGIYNFKGCTLYNTGSRYVDHQKETLLMSNFVADGNNNVYPQDLTTTFTNCIIYGSLENEVSFNQVNGAAFNNTFDYNLVKAKIDSFHIFVPLGVNIFNQDPRFRDPDHNDFTPSDSSGYLSPALDAAPSAPLPTDIYGNQRGVNKISNGTPYDIGAVETQ